MYASALLVEIVRKLEIGLHNDPIFYLETNIANISR
jgi:hypothetical protein